jgi:RimJ/RimL family protein N-acetyltransferase
MDNYSVYLRAFEPDDYLLINNWRNDRNIQKMTCGNFRYVSTEMEKSWVNGKMLNNTTDIYLAICLNDGSKKMIGYTSINNVDMINRKADCGGIVIGEKNERNGKVLIDAFLLIFEHVFDDMGIHRFTGACLEEHKNSRIMMEMLGFKKEGISVDSIYKEHKYHNVYNYVILDTDYHDFVNKENYSEMSIAIRVSQIRKTI